MTKLKDKKTTKQSPRLLVALIVAAIIALGLVAWYLHNTRTRDINSFRAQPFNRVYPMAHPQASPSGLTPGVVRTVYNLGSSTGSGTIAIIDAFDDSHIESDLGVFSQQFGLSSCTTSNGCFEKHKMTSKISTSADWALESALDVEWAHAIAPGAKVLLVEAVSNSGSDLIKALD